MSALLAITLILVLLHIFVPLTLAIIFILFYLTFRTVAETLMVMLGVPFALFGGFLLLYLLGSITI
ncbi:hypothetical protein [Legionella londiniensis]|nr:hypothetical protein [Legionella londiniensis]